ncbi:uncharacterized protein LOC124445001 [Xenia sp. Carnegie-2017]|uniref:uncharacterized protein LOC124445001 n=1 Tax=Xenia sp. Carnegie-2017 TaxID=2897299 RepID=UPI001F03C94C|nr:uncharacterized protein LOC124445001 [Xenia sp. Carnegie-2017]
MKKKQSRWFIWFIFVILTIFYILLNEQNTALKKRSITLSPSIFFEEKVKSRIKKKVIIFVGIMSAPQRKERRNAIRTTWLKQCRKNSIPCLFFTDARDMYGNLLPPTIRAPLMKEQSIHRDLILAQSPGGINFALRYLWMLNWANSRYKFEYFLRVDDDYFVCMDRLVRELPYRSQKKLYWGYVHCSPPGGIRVDEGFVIVSNDLAQHFLRERNSSLMCHPYGDQAMIMWINNIPGVTYFGDPRVINDVVDYTSIVKTGDICASFLGVHGSYPWKMKKFWSQFLEMRTETYHVPEITYPCGSQSKTFVYKNFGGMFYAVPRPCKENPAWQIGEFYQGRES